MALHGKLRFTITAFALGAALAGCTNFPIQEMSEAEHVARLTSQGFELTADGRNSAADSALRYKGSPTPVIRCIREDGSDMDLSPIIGPLNLIGRPAELVQDGQVNAMVIAQDNGRVRGTYFYTVERRIFQDRKLAGAELETIEFPPDGSAVMSNKTTCGPRY